MTSNNKHGYLAVGANGSSRIINVNGRSEARSVARTHPNFSDTDLVGLVDLADLARTFGGLVRTLNIGDARDLGLLVELLANMPGQAVDSVRQKLLETSLQATQVPSIEPFGIDESKTLGLEAIDNAEWSDDPSRDRDLVFSIVAEAIRARAIIEPTLNGETVDFSVMPVGYRGEWPAHDLFIRLLLPGIEHIAGDMVPLEDTDFFEICVDLAGTEEGPAFGKAILTMVLSHAAIIFQHFETHLSPESRKTDELATDGKEA